MTHSTVICPSCKSEQIDILLSGLWDGADKSGRGTSGMFEYGVCKQCGGRCAQYVEGQPYVPTEEEWQRRFAPIEKYQRKRESWPFDPEDDNHVA